MVVLVFICIFLFLWMVVYWSKATDLESRLAEQKRRYDELESQTHQQVDKKLSQAEEKLAKAESKLERVETKEAKIDEAASELKRIKDEIVHGEEKLKRERAKLEELREEVSCENTLLRSAVEEVTNLWINDSWRSIRDRLTAENFATQKSRMEKVFETCRKMGIAFDSRDEAAFYDQLRISWEQEVIDQKVKNEQARVRERMREEAKVEKARASELKRIEAEAKELEERRKETEERLRILKELEALKQLTTEQKKELEAVSMENEGLLTELAEKERAKSMAEMTRAGNVYVISNIGSFGEGVYKVGMTRRLIPEDRVKELGDASVPFPFDVHMMIPTDDAPTLEANLHEALWSTRLNLVNDGKEFFRVDLGTIKNLVEQFGGTVAYYYHEYPEALQWRESDSRRKLGETGKYDVSHEEADDSDGEAA